MKRVDYRRIGFSDVPWKGCYYKITYRSSPRVEYLKVLQVHTSRRRFLNQPETKVLYVQKGKQVGTFINGSYKAMNIKRIPKLLGITMVGE